MKYISLGLSCQTRLALEEIFGKQPRRPFDWTITDKAALLAGFETKGASFHHEVSTSEVVYRAGREGIVSNGIYFWHDYPKSDRRTLVADWGAATCEVNAKYSGLWERFLDELSQPGEKTFVIGTTQDNLVEFADDDEDFRDRYSLNAEFIDNLALALGKVCPARFSILALARSAEEIDATRGGCSFERLSLHFCGPLALRDYHPIVNVINTIEVTRDPQYAT